MNPEKSTASELAVRVKTAMKTSTDIIPSQRHSHVTNTVNVLELENEMTTPYSAPSVTITIREMP
jgi:hypothetical protein